MVSHSGTIHQRNLQLPLMDIYKTRNNLTPSFMKQIFEAKVLPYNLRCSEKLKLPKAKTTDLGIDTVRFVEGGESMGDATTCTEKIKLPYNFQKAY